MPARSFLLLIFSLMIFGIQGVAQNTGNEMGDDWDVSPNLNFGVKFGYNLSKLVSEELPSSNYKSGMVVGLSAQYAYKKHIQFRGEVNGCIKGGKFSFTPAESLEKLSLFYLDVPLTVGYRVSQKIKLTPFAGVQPSVVFRKDAYKKGEAVPQPVIMNILNYDLGLVGGFYYGISDVVGIQLMAQYGVLNVNKSLTLPFYPYLGAGKPLYNRSLQLCLVF